ncbi:MAG: mechanosensitive ion channel domain-containing protein [Cyanobacteria bacterium J06633_2]
MDNHPQLKRRFFRWRNHPSRSTELASIRLPHAFHWGLVMVSLRRSLKQFVWMLLFCVALVVTVMPHAVHGQSLDIDGVRQAPVVIDGNVRFQVRDAGALTAPERAEQINQKLSQELRSPRLAEIFVVQKDSLVYLQSRHTDEILATITESDVLLSRRKPFEQARILATTLQTALRQGQLERRPSYLRQAAVYSGLVLLGAIAIHLGLHFFGKFGNRRLSRWLDNQSNPLINWERSLKLFWQLGLLGIQAGVWINVIYTVTDIFPQARGWRYQFATARVIDLGSRDYSALDLLFFCLSAIAFWLVVSLIARIFRFYVLNQTGLEQRAQDILGVFVQYALIFLGGVVLLQIWDIDMSSLTILASVLGVGLGFGVQNITNNFISGFIITLERPVQVGDFINVGELVGTVERVGARSTEIRTLDQVTIIVPNSRFLENEVINWSHGNPVSRLHLPVGVAYGSRIDKVKVALLEAVRRHPDVLLTPKPEVWFQGFGESAMQFDILVWTGEPRNQFRVKSDLYYRIEASLHRHDVAIPFPQRDLHVRSPQLNELLAVLQHRFDSGNSIPSDAALDTQSAGTSSHSQSLAVDDLSARDSNSPNGQTQPMDEPSTDINGSTSDVDEASSILPHESLPALDFLERIDFEALADTMAEVDGVPVSDRTYQGQLHPLCFTGTDVVEWLIQQQEHTREEAILIGQGLLQQGLIRPVSESQAFRDGYYFYRFYQDEQKLTRDDATTEPSTGSEYRYLGS